MEFLSLFCFRQHISIILFIHYSVTYMTSADFWKGLAGLGMFLYGMFQLEDTTRQINGRGFKVFLRDHTKNKLSAIINGTFVTAVFQSSSIVNLMVLSFVGAGMLSMRNALSVSLGSNIGGTLNSWLIALLGFKVEISKFSLPIIGIAGLGLIIFRNKKNGYRVAKFLMSLGLLFIGLDFLKDSMDGVMENFNLQPYLTYNRLIFVVIGLILTTLLQTSAATVVIVLTALYSKLIPIETGVAFVLGAELGTTVKLVIGSIGGSSAKKQVAFSSVLFNVFIAVFGFILLTPIIDVLRSFFGLRDPLLLLVSFQTFINLAGVSIFYFWLNYLGDFLEKRFITTAKPNTSFLHDTDPDLPGTAIDMMEKEVSLFITRVIRFDMYIFQIDNSFRTLTTIEKNVMQAAILSPVSLYDQLKQAEGEILSFYAKMASSESAKQNNVRLNQLMTAVRNAMASAKGMKDIDQDRKEFSDSGSELKFGIYKLFRTKLSEFYHQAMTVFEDPANAGHYDTLVKMLENINQQYDARIIRLYEHAAKNDLKEIDISTLFNLNRQLYSSCKSIIFSMKDYLLDGEQAIKFENKPGFILK